MNSRELDISSSFTQLGISILSNLTWKPHTHSIAQHASQKLGFLSRACGYFSPSQLLTIYNPRFILLWSTALMSRVVLLNLLSIFLTGSSLKLSVSSTIQTSLILYSLSPIVVLLQISPFSTAIFTDIALRKSRILFLIQRGVFEPTEALPIHTLSKLHFLIHGLYLTSHLSFLELLNCGTHCHLLLSLNPTICHLLNLTSTNLVLSPSPLKLPHSLSFSFVGVFL